MKSGSWASERAELKNILKASLALVAVAGRSSSSNLVYHISRRNAAAIGKQCCVS